MIINHYDPIQRMLELAKDKPADQEAIPISIFVAEWESQYGMDVPYYYLEEMEREFPKGFSVATAMEYWASLDGWFGWFIDNGDILWY